MKRTKSATTFRNPNHDHDEPYAKVEERLLYSAVSDGAVRLYAILIRHTNKEGVCWPSINRLADKMHVSQNTVLRRLAELQEVGVIERIRRKQAENAGNASNLYRFPSTSSWRIDG